MTQRSKVQEFEANDGKLWDFTICVEENWEGVQSVLVENATSFDPSDDQTTDFPGYYSATAKESVLPNDLLAYAWNQAIDYEVKNAAR